MRQVVQVEVQAGVRAGRRVRVCPRSASVAYRNANGSQCNAWQTIWHAHAAKNSVRSQRRRMAATARSTPAPERGARSCYAHQTRMPLTARPDAAGALSSNPAARPPVLRPPEVSHRQQAATPIRLPQQALSAGLLRQAQARAIASKTAASSGLRTSERRMRSVLRARSRQNTS